MKIGFAMCGSFCTFSKVFPLLETLSQNYEVYPIFSTATSTIDSRFGKATEFIYRAESITKRPVWNTIAQVEPIGPKKILDALVIAPCTGNTLAKLSHGIADGPVTMAAKSHLRNGRPVVIAISTNDGLSVAAENIGRLMARRNYFFVPFAQDDHIGKPTSLVADFSQIPETLTAALQGTQFQPLLLR